MNKWKKALALVTVGASLMACQGPVSKIQAQVHHYTPKQTCPTLKDLKVGEVLVFTAPENPSTGYQWQLLQPLKLFKIEESYLAEESDDPVPVVGMGGEKSFRFTAVKPGQALIELAYVRPWESNKQSEIQWHCRIRVS